MVVTLPVAQWLICIWKARSVRAPWWALLVMTLLLLGVERVTRPREASCWPELVRACVSLVITMHVAVVLVGDAHRLLVPVVFCMAVWGVRDEIPSYGWEGTVTVIVNLVGLGAGLWNVCGGALDDAGDWVQLVFLMHTLLAGTVHETYAGVMAVRTALALSVVVIAEVAAQPAAQPQWVGLLVLPCIGMSKAGDTDLHCSHNFINNAQRRADR